ncbi:TPA: hypothetical protein JLG89_004306 [Escherichia coli]|nr:hypothetical protein [Escherichia coli]
MGHYTIRTNDDEDQAIKKAQEVTGQAASKTFMTAILELQRNRDEIAQLRRELVQEQAKNKELIASVQQFRSSMNAMFKLAGNNKS